MTQKNKPTIFSIIAIFSIISILFISGCIQPPINAQAKELPKFSSCDAIKTAFEQSQQRGYGVMYPMMGIAEKTAQSATADGSAAPAPSYSNTNVQVQGVDEADIVKTDGKYIYTVSNGKLNITLAYPASEAKLVSSTDLKKVYPQEMFVQANTLLVFGSSYEQIKLPPQTEPVEGGQTVPGSQPTQVVEQNTATITTTITDTNTKPAPAENSEQAQTTDASSRIAVRPIGAGGDYFPYPQYYSKNLAAALLFDISDKENPKLERSLEFEGSYLSSRMIGDKVYFVINSYPNYYAMQNKESKVEDILPTFRERNSGEIIAKDIEKASAELKPIAPCSEIAYFPPMQAQSFVTLAGLSMSDLGSNVEKQTIVGSGQNVYASNNNLYIAEVQYNYAVAYNNGSIGVAVKGIAEQVGTAIVDTVTGNDSSGGTTEPANEFPNPNAPQPTDQNTGIVTPEPIIPEPVPGPEPKPILPQPAPVEDTQKTIIHKFSLSDGKIEYLGNMEAKGTILNQFSMDEFNEHFRIATTIQKWSAWNTTTGSKNLSTNNVYVFDENFKQVGMLEDLAPGETIYSARFAGERAYLVTFERIDPFFVIDLSSPENPKVLGSLKIPGYSNYLHPLDATHVLGVGKEAIDASFEPGFAWYLGMKMAIFDVTDPTNPIELHKITIGDRGTDSAALYDHKAFLYDAEKHLLVLPIALYEIDDSVKNQYGSLPDNWPQYGVFKYQGAFVYNLTIENGFKEIGRITHNTPEEIQKMGYWYYGYGNEVKRSLYIDNTLYTVSDGKIKANDLTNLTEIASIDLPKPEQQYYPNVYEATVSSPPMIK